LIFIFIFFSVIKNNFSKKEEFVEIKVLRDNLSSSFRISGNVEPRNRLPIKPQIAGRIEDIFVKEGEKVKKGQVIAYLSSQERAALLDIAKSQGEEVYKQWQEVYKPTPIVAPLDGFIIVRDKEPGQTITNNDYIVVMADELIIKAYIDETDLKYIKLGRIVKCTLDAYSEIEFLGKIEHIAYESTLINNVTVYEIKIKPILTEKKFSFKKHKDFISYKDKVKKENIDKKILIPPDISSILRSGMTATIEVVAEERKNVLVLPVNAIEDTSKEKYVLLKKGKEIIRQVVITGLSNGKNVEIISGLDEGDVVLIRKKQGKYFDKSPSVRFVRQNPMSAFFRR
ncbi:MAG: efflux RND transporter periplasmic adaptor subunit, partial [Endomicrobiia bacterium]